ncbi:hypothetical protein [Parasutterella secunda]|uniref:hypothetical protein n=1 Tax=Parasutterella secunda TaxID=626947 RepID=UPI0025A333CC|nr:hypothetical protein [Parasutterella secunda]MDM8227807.1 hypothetical protein [Parasutterella secunda]
MSKKSFKGLNPLDQLITPKERQDEPKEKSVAEQVSEYRLEPTEDEDKAAAQEAAATDKKAPDKELLQEFGLIRVERKTKHVNVLLKPSVYEASKRASKRLGVSFNEFVSMGLEKILKGIGEL